MVHPQSAGAETRTGCGPVLASVSASLDIRSKLPLARLPMMPQVLVRLLDLCHRDDVDFNDIANVIRRDAGMSAKVISVASSASQYGRSRPASLNQCLTILGMSTIKTIVINESVLQVFRRFTMDRDFDLRRFWGHSLRCALIARDLAKAIGYANHEEAYLGGLMHDVGQLAILAADADTYSPLLFAYGDHDELCRREQAVFDLTHAEVGAWLVEKWELDSFLSDSVLYHHDSVERVVGGHALVRIVFLANRLSVLRGAAPGAEEAEVAGVCGAGGVDLPPLLEKVGQELVELAEQLGIELVETLPADAPASDYFVAGGAADLAVRVRDVLLVDSVLGGSAVSDGLEAALHCIAQAARVLFNIDPAICFIPQGADNERRSDYFLAHPIGSRWAKASQLEFKRGDSDAEVARAIDDGVLLVAADERPQNMLDAQLLRLIGGAGLVLVPLRSQRVCHGVLVAGFSSALQTAALRERIPCLEHLARMAGEMLRKAGSCASAASKPANPDVDALRERLHRVVHEIGNPLSIIQNYLSTLEMKYAASDIGVRELGIVTEEIGRVSKILQAALQEPNEGRSSVGAIKLNPVIDDMVALCRSSGFVARSVEIQTDLFVNPPELWSDSDRLKQLLLNLLKNAVEALAAQGGIVRVSTAPWGSGVGPTHIEVRIEDSGPGIPADVLAQLYQPVSSTKGQHHLGVGLAIVGELVRDLHGLINCRSNDRGTSFQLLLPLSKQ